MIAKAAFFILGIAVGVVLLYWIIESVPQP